MYASVESDREYARNVGQFERERAWILAPSDAWYQNPFYTGPAVPHPEDDGPDFYSVDDFGRPMAGHPDFIGPLAPINDEIPF